MLAIRRATLCAIFVMLVSGFCTRLQSQPTLREKIGQMIMVTFTGDSLEKSSASLDTLKTDIAEKRIGGVIFFTWSGNLRSPAQIGHLTQELQSRSSVPLLIATDQEGGRVARLSASNGFGPTQSAYNMGTNVNTESNTRAVAGMMAGWFEQTGINMNLAPVVDVNVNPTSPAIGFYERSFSASAATVTQHAGWFIDEFRKRSVVTALKHFPGHGSAVGDSHLGFTDVTTTWTTMELEPFQDLINTSMVDAIMTAHIFNAQFDSAHPATLSSATMTDLLRTQMGFDGVVVSDAMEMGAITSLYGFSEAAVGAIKAGVDILLYTRNLTDTGTSLAGDLIDVIEAHVHAGMISMQRIDESYDRIITLKQKYRTGVETITRADVPFTFSIGSYPNPFNGSVHIRLQSSAIGQATVAVYDLLGRPVVELHNGPLSAGPSTFRWTPESDASGTYIVRVTINDRTRSLRILYLR